MLYMFDLDDTLIKGFLSGEGNKPLPYDAVELLPNRLATIQRLTLRDPHACFAIVTNQGGVAFGHQTVSQVEAKLARVVQAFHFFYSKAYSVHCCFTHHNAPESINGIDNPWRIRDPRRKPGPGMLDEAMQAHRLVTPTAAVYIGDLPSDAAAAEAAKVAYFEADQFFAMADGEI